MKMSKLEQPLDETEYKIRTMKRKQGGYNKAARAALNVVRRGVWDFFSAVSGSKKPVAR